MNPKCVRDKTKIVPYEYVQRMHGVERLQRSTTSNQQQRVELKHKMQEGGINEMAPIGNIHNIDHIVTHYARRVLFPSLMSCTS